jgi:hypothetical protein
MTKAEMIDANPLPWIIVFSIAAALFWSVLVGGILYYKACRQADVYNLRHGTTWSCGDFFWARTQINSETKTLELNFPPRP